MSGMVVVVLVLVVLVVDVELVVVVPGHGPGGTGSCGMHHVFAHSPSLSPQYGGSMH